MDLKPCPFCGSEPMWKIDSGFIYYIFCSNLACVCRDTRPFKSEQEAVEAWNKRSTDRK